MIRSRRIQTLILNHQMTLTLKVALILVQTPIQATLALTLITKIMITRRVKKVSIKKETSMIINIRRIMITRRVISMKMMMERRARSLITRKKWRRNKKKFSRRISRLP